MMPWCMKVDSVLITVVSACPRQQIVSGKSNMIEALTLTTTLGSSRDKYGGVLVSEGSLSPEAASRVPEGLLERQHRYSLCEQGRHTFHCAGKLPKRVGTPKMKPSNLGSSSEVMTG